MDNDLISREALKKEIKAYSEYDPMLPNFKVIKIIDNAPTVEPSFGLFRSLFCETCQAYATNRAIVKLADEYTRPHGEWLEPFESNGKTYHKCTHCHISSELILFGNFCPNCGADMREEVNR